VQAAHSPVSFDRYVREASRHLLVIVFGGCLVVSIAAPDLLRLLFGDSFSDGGRVLAILVWSEVAVFFGVVMTNSVLALGLQRLLPLITGAGAVANLALNAVLIPRMGAVGAAWATVVSYSVAGIFMYLLFPATRSLAWQSFTSGWPALPASLLALVIGSWVPWSLGSRLVLSVAVYAGALLFAGTIRRSDLQLLRTAAGALARPGPATGPTEQARHD
jgi:O-antigen/teichoic acid export membrane protein